LNQTQPPADAGESFALTGEVLERADPDAPKPKPKRHASKLLPDDPAFREWFAQYPRRVAKDSAAKAYQKAIDRIARERGITPAEAHGWLVEVTRRFAGSKKGRMGEYCPYPATWLNAGRYDDDPREWELERGGQGWASDVFDASKIVPDDF
jgi:hypothetical protein